MAAQDPAALERQEEVLPDRLDREQAPAVEQLGDPPDLRPWIRRLHLEVLTDERSKAARRPVKCISLGHRVLRIGT
jgi:hypothetical protein